MQTITKLVAENFKRLTAVTIVPDGSVVVLGGENEAGKTSTLDAIEAVLGGKKHAPSEPVKRGTKRARVVVETEKITATRKWDAKGKTTLEVVAKDGSLFASPQAMLNDLLGSLTFDPLAFERQKPPEQAATLRDLVGIDFAAEDDKRKAAFDARTDINRECKRLQGALDKLPDGEGPPGVAVSVAELTDELERRRAVNATNEARRIELGRLRSDAVAVAAEVRTAEAKLAELNAKGQAMAGEVKALEDENVGEVREQISTAESTNASARAFRERERLNAELDAAIDQSQKLTDRIEQIDTIKRETTEAAKYPIDGLELGDEGVVYQGLPFEQASHGVRVKVSVAIGLALNPEFPVMLVRDGSRLDDSNLAMVAAMAETAGGQVWIETVGDRSGVTVVIEEGAVAATRKKSTSAPKAAAASKVM